MSNETALALVPRNMSECNDLAKQLAESSLLPASLKGKIPEVLMTIMAGQELGIPPIAALRSIHVIEGKTVLSADIMQAVVLGNGSAKYVKRISADDKQATYETCRTGETEPRQMTWTIEMAKNAGLYPKKDNWRMYTRQMLSARCKAELLKDVYADSLAGCYTPDEADNFSRPDQPVIDAEFSERSTPPPLAIVESPLVAIRDKFIADIAATTTRLELEGLLPRFADLPKKPMSDGKDRAIAYEAYNARLAEYVSAEVAEAVA